MHIQIRLDTKFWIKFLDQISTNRVFPNSEKKKKEEKENHHQILHIQINLDSKFQLQQKILIIGANLQKRKNFSSKTEKMNITIKFFIFKLV